MTNDIFSSATGWLVGIINCLPAGLGLFTFLPFVVTLIIFILKKVFS